MALTQAELNKIKGQRQSDIQVTRIGRINLGRFLAKYAGKLAVFDEFTNRDEVKFTFYWSAINTSEFMETISKNPKINKQMAKAFFDNLFKYSNTGQQLIYAQRRTTLPEVVTFDPASSYTLTVDLLHAEGTDKATGQHFSKYYTKILNVTPQRNIDQTYVTFTEHDMKAIPHENENNDDVASIDHKE